MLEDRLTGQEPVQRDLSLEHIPAPPLFHDRRKPQRPDQELPNHVPAARHVSA
jgi:hypothetical protein